MTSISDQRGHILVFLIGFLLLSVRSSTPIAASLFLPVAGTAAIVLVLGRLLARLRRFAHYFSYVIYWCINNKIQLLDILNEKR